MLWDWVRKGQLQMQLLGPNLGGPCTPPYKLLKRLTSNLFSLRFDNSFRRGFGLWNLGKGGGLGNTTQSQFWLQELEGSEMLHHVPQEP